MRTYATSILLWASLIINEAHTLFSPDYGLLKMYANVQVNFHGFTFPIQWFAWLISNSIWGVLIGSAVLLYKENKINRAAVRAYFTFCVIDTFMFFYNYKQHDYAAIYTVLFASVFFFYGQYDKLMIRLKKYFNGTGKNGLRSPVQIGR